VGEQAVRLGAAELAPATLLGDIGKRFEDAAGHRLAEVGRRNIVDGAGQNIDRIDGTLLAVVQLVLHETMDALGWRCR
jgi:hypothetical protein